MSDWSTGQLDSLVSNAGDYPPTPAGVNGSDALGIFQSLSGTALGAVKTLQDFQIATANAAAQRTIATTNAQTQATLSQIQAQATLARAQAALRNPNNSLMLILAIVGIGIAWMQYAK